jgi:putative ABC transport system permease protein
MALLPKIRSFLRNVIFYRRVDADLDSEIQSHLRLLKEEYTRRGMAQDEAERAARLELGGIEQVKEQVREQRVGNYLRSVYSDCRYALRQLRRSPVFTTVAILTLALGIGANTAIFSVVDRVLFRNLPYPHDDRLVSFGVKAPFEGIEFMLAPEYVVLRAKPGPYESMTSLNPAGADCDVTEANPVRLRCALVESTFLSTLGIHPMLGRDLTPADDLPNAPGVALISQSLWRSRFGGDPNIPGKSFSLDGKPVEIIGVLPASFEMPTLNPADMLLPQALDESALDRAHPRDILRTFARLKPGITIDQAAAALQPWFQDSLRFVPPQFRAEVFLRVRSLRDRQISDSRMAAWVLFGSVIAVLLLACTNLANLLLVRASSRQRELSVRSALGATRGRLIRQALTESVLLALLGSLVGCGLAYVLLRVFISIAPQGIVRLQQASLDLRVFDFCLVVSLLCGFLSGAAPALARPLPETLVGRTTRATTRGFFRHTLVAAQIAGSLILLAAAAMLLRSLWNIQNVPIGLDTQNIVTAKFSLPDYRYPDKQKQLAFFQELEIRLSRVPGVEKLAFANSLPPSGQEQATFFASIEVPSHPRLQEGTGGMVGFRMVTPAYFHVLSIPILRGRSFTEADRLPSEDPVILSEALAAKLLPNEDPLGKLFRFTSGDTQGHWRRIVGIAANVKNNGIIAGADPEFYLPWKEDPGIDATHGYAILRSPLNPTSLVPWVRSQIAQVDPVIPVEFATMSARVGQLKQRLRFDAVLLSLFALFALLLAALGIYGVVSFFVLQRTQEIGVRMALGATPRSISRMVLLSLARWTASGSALGLLGSWLGARFLQSLLFEVRAHDPVPIASALVILLCVAFMAAWIPARRAGRVDPLVALRYE